MVQPLFLILLTHTVCLVSYIIFRQERTKKEQWLMCMSGTHTNILVR